jgi:hypothetical protein
MLYYIETYCPRCMAIVCPADLGIRMVPEGVVENASAPDTFDGLPETVVEG